MCTVKSMYMFIHIATNWLIAYPHKPQKCWTKSNIQLQQEKKIINFSVLKWKKKSHLYTLE